MCPLTRLAGRPVASPCRSGGIPVANTTVPGWISPEVVETVTMRLPLTVTEVAAAPVAMDGTTAARRASARSGLTLA